MRRCYTLPKERGLVQRSAKAEKIKVISGAY